MKILILFCISMIGLLYSPVGLSGCYEVKRQGGQEIFALADNLFLQDGVLSIKSESRSGYYSCQNTTVKFKEIKSIHVGNSNTEPWMSSIAQERQELGNTLRVMYEQYLDLSNRLTILHDDRERLIRKYNDESFIKQIDEDIKYLSSIGMKLAKVTKRFFKSIKPKLQQLDLARTRQKALRGLRDFETKIDNIHDANFESLETIVSEIENAVMGLEKSVNRSSLPAQTYTLTVNTTPSGSRVRIMNIVPAYYSGIRLKSGKYEIEVSHSGYKTYRKWIKINSDSTIDVVLDKSVAYGDHVSAEEVKSKLDCDGAYTNGQKEMFFHQYQHKRVVFNEKILSIRVDDNRISLFGEFFTGLPSVVPRDRTVFTKIQEGGTYSFDCRITNYCEDGFFDGELSFDDCLIQSRF